MAYGIFLLLHSLLRWVVVLAGLVLVGACIQAKVSGAKYQPLHRMLGKIFVSSVHLNFVIGLILYVALSPTTQAAFADVGAAMKQSALRFFLVEHVFGMLVAVALVTVGAATVKRTVDDAKKLSRATIYFGAGLLMILLSIPWPFYPAGRPLFWLAF